MPTSQESRVLLYLFPTSQVSTGMAFIEFPNIDPILYVI
jgi:hypothetical protein